MSAKVMSVVGQTDPLRVPRIHQPYGGVKLQERWG